MAELATRCGVISVAKTTRDSSKFKSSIVPSESVSAAGGDKHGKKNSKDAEKESLSSGIHMCVYG